MSAFTDWLNQSNAQRYYLVELTALKLADLSTVALYLSNRPVYFPGRQYIPCISGLPSLDRAANDTLNPAALPTWGELELDLNPAYMPDAERTTAWNLLLYKESYTFMGQPVTIKLGGYGWDYAEYVVIFSGRVSRAQWNANLLSLTIYDRVRDLDLKVPDYELPESALVPEGNWNQPLPVVLGSVKNLKAVLVQLILSGPYAYKYAAACHVVDEVSQVYVNGLAMVAGSWEVEQRDISPAGKDGAGSATIETAGPYTGTLLRAEWLVQIDSITALNSQGESGPDVGLATFRWSLDNGATWEDSGLLTWKLTPGTVANAPSVGNGTMALSGDYSGDCKLDYAVKLITAGEIGGSPTPQISWSDDGGDTWSAAVDLEEGSTPGSTGPIALSNGLSAVFTGGAGSGVWSTFWQPVGSAPGVMSLSAIDPSLDAKLLEVEITTSGNVGDLVRYKWQYNSEGWTTDQQIPDTSPINLVPAMHGGAAIIIQFTDPGPGSGTDYEAGDSWQASYTKAFVVDDQWVWSFDEAPVPLAEGVTLEWTPGSGDDFQVGDEWRFILYTSFKISGLTETTDITCDVKGAISPATNSYAGTVGEMIRALILMFSDWTEADFDAAALAAFDAAFPYEAGIAMDSPTEMSGIITSLLAGLPSLYTLTMDGLFRLQELIPPSGTPDLELGQVEIFESPDGANIDENLCRRVYLKYDRNYSTQQNLNGVTQERLEWLRRDYRQVSVRDESVRSTYPWAVDLGPIETCLSLAAEAKLLAGKLLDLYKLAHETVEVKCAMQGAGVNIGDLVRLTWDEFGRDAGQLYLVIGISLDFSANESTLKLWR
jgi:hypothetical protein